MKNKIIIAPSILAADFTRLGDEVKRVEDAGCDWIHIDVMDGRFVPNISIGPLVVRSIRKMTRLILDVHLMIDSPWKHIVSFKEAGADIITVHEEACKSKLNDVLNDIKKLGIKRGVSIKPNTGIDRIKPVLNNLDLVLIMSVNPGFGGQEFISDVLPKIQKLRSIFDNDISVDGGINPSTGRKVLSAGANVLVAGTAIFKSGDVKKIIHEMRSE